MRQNVRVVLGVTIALLAMGCSGKYKNMVSDKDMRIAELEDQIKGLQAQVEEEEARNEELNEELARALSDYREREQVWLEEKGAMSVITVSDAVLFNSGSSDLSPTGRDIVGRIAEVAKNHPGRALQVEGHTDDVPIGASLKDRYQSNWELASARACSVARYLYWKHKLDPKRLSAIGYGEHRPVADNDSAEGRAKNRRVVIVIGGERS